MSYIPKVELKKIINDEPGRVEKVSCVPDRCNVKVDTGKTTTFFASLANKNGDNDEGIAEMAWLIEHLIQSEVDFIMYYRRADNMFAKHGIDNMSKVMFRKGKAVKSQKLRGHIPADPGAGIPAPAPIAAPDPAAVAPPPPPPDPNAKFFEYEGVTVKIDTRAFDKHIAAHIPGDNSFIPDKMNTKRCLAVIANKQPLLLQGHTGVGKTEFIKWIAHKLNKPLLIVQGAEDMETSTLLGHHEIDEKGTFWVDGLVPTAMKAGYMLYFDEINACPAGVKIALHGLLDDTRAIVLADHHGEKVKAHDDFIFVAACNPSDHGAYIGAGAENLAFLNRFSKIQIGYPDARVEKRILKGFTHVSDDVKDKLIKAANMVRDIFLQDEIMGVISTRDLKNICANLAFLTVDEALSIALTKFSADDCKRALDCCEQHFGVLSECQKLIRS